MKNYNLYTFIWNSNTAPSLQETADFLHIGIENLDSSFGVVPVDPETSTYCVMIDEEASAKLNKNSGLNGPFSNPKIEPFDLQ